MSPSKPYAESSEQNREPIFNVLQAWFADRSAVLEVGSGTGQHAVYFAEKMPHLTWHCSDREENHAGIHLWLQEAALPNTRPPLRLDVLRDPWPDDLYVDAVFSANTTHIMHWPDVQALFAGIGQLLPPQGLFALYGPFNDHHAYTSDSNASFDVWLKQRDPDSGIRNFQDLDALANTAGLSLLHDVAMPANNRILCWCK